MQGRGGESSPGTEGAGGSGVRELPGRNAGSRVQPPARSTVPMVSMVLREDPEGQGAFWFQGRGRVQLVFHRDQEMLPGCKQARWDRPPVDLG